MILCCCSEHVSIDALQQRGRSKHIKIKLIFVKRIFIDKLVTGFLQKKLLEFGFGLHVFCHKKQPERTSQLPWGAAFNTPRKPESPKDFPIGGQEVKVHLPEFEGLPLRGEGLEEGSLGGWGRL